VGGLSPCLPSLCSTDRPTRLHQPLSTGLNQPTPTTNNQTTQQGELEVTTLAGTGKGKAAASETDVTERVPFLLLALDLPPTPLFKDAMEKNIIPQVGSVGLVG
jgi:hypothetical protein